MSAAGVKHIVAVPFPGRGHVNALLSFCDLLLGSTLPESNTIITFAVTEEWLDILTASKSQPLPRHPQRFRFGTMPNVVPSERNRGADHAGFVHAVLTKMEPHLDHLLAALDPPASAIVADTYVPWAVAVGNSRQIPVFSFFPMPPAVFSFLFHYQRLVERGVVPVPVILDDEGRPLSSKTVPVVELPADEGGQILAECFPGVSCGLRLPDFTSLVNYALPLALCLPAFERWVRRAEGVIFNTVYELDRPVIDALRADPELPFPVYTIGPCIPFDKRLIRPPGAADTVATANGSNGATASDYLSWLDAQPSGSALYVSLGSFLTTSTKQMEELALGLLHSGALFLWVLREESRCPLLEDALERAAGMTVPWCNQLQVLCHPSVGAFLTHCGWNSTLEGLFAGKPMLGMPIIWDQPPIGAMIAQGWGLGLRLKAPGKERNVVGRDTIADAVRTVMGPSPSADKFRKKAIDVMKACSGAILDGNGSSTKNLEDLVREIEHARSCLI